MAADPPVTEQLVAVGAVGAAVGVRGDVAIVSWTDDPLDRFAPGAVLRTDRAEPATLSVASARQQGARLVAHFDGVEDRDAAEALRRTQLFVLAASRPALADPDEFYDSDLTGLTAVDPAGTVLGEVDGVEHGAGHDLLVVRRSGRNHLVPFVAAIVTAVDVAGGRVVIDAPEGLWDIS